VTRFRGWVRNNKPALALLLLAPSIPELLTGSTPISELVFNPFGFAVGFPLDIALYGGGALLIREFTVVYRKGWASVLLLGAAYGIAEEGFEVHTFFETSGAPANNLATYGHLFGVNWLLALVITIFHATYSIALPILLVRLWFPASKDARWLGRGTITLLAGVYIAEVVGFGGLVVKHGPSPSALAFFVALDLALVVLAAWAPRELLRAVPGPRRIRLTAFAILGAIEFTVYFFVLIISSFPAFPAVATAAVVVAANGGVLLLLLRTAGTEDLERTEFVFAVGMFSVLFLWDVLIEFILVPGILAVSAVFVYLLYRLDRTLKARAYLGTVPLGAAGLPPAGP
jgi:hypothetical protein